MGSILSCNINTVKVGHKELLALAGYQTISRLNKIHCPILKLSAVYDPTNSLERIQGGKMKKEAETEWFISWKRGGSEEVRVERNGSK